jgi:hypothetical protein
MSLITKSVLKTVEYTGLWLEYTFEYDFTGHFSNTLYLELIK